MKKTINRRFLNLLEKVKLAVGEKQLRSNKYKQNIMRVTPYFLISLKANLMQDTTKKETDSIWEGKVKGKGKQILGQRNAFSATIKSSQSNTQDTTLKGPGQIAEIGSFFYVNLKRIFNNP